MKKASFSFTWGVVAGAILGAVIHSAKAEDSCQVINQDVNTPAPAALKDGYVTIHNKDGSERIVPSNDFKVVKRQQQFKVKEVITTKEVVKTVAVPVEVITNHPKKNRISLLAGQGPKTGLTQVGAPPGAVALESNTGVIFGISYQRMLNDTISIGAQGSSNKSLMGSIGVDF